MCYSDLFVIDRRHMEYGAYGGTPDRLPEKFRLADTIGRKPRCEVRRQTIGARMSGGDGIRSGWTLATIKERARKGARLIRILYIVGSANTAELPLAGLGNRRSAALAIAKRARGSTLQTVDMRAA